MSFQLSWLSECLKQSNFLWSLVPAGGQSHVCSWLPNEEGCIHDWYRSGTLDRRTCFFNFPTWHRAKPRTLQESFVLLDLNVSTRLSQSGGMLFWISHSVRTEIQTGLFRFLTLFYIYFWALVSPPYGGPEHLPHEYWASVANSLLPLNSRRVRFLVWGRCHDRCIPQQNSKSCFNSSVWLLSSRQDDMSPMREPFGKELNLQPTLNLHFYS